MKKVILTISALILGTAGASAADLGPSYTKAPPVVAAAPTWTGWYVGLNAGGDWGDSKGGTSVVCSGAGGSCYIPSYLAAINALGAGQTINTSGFTGGVQAGYNWQSGSWLFGLEADFQYFRSAGTRTVTGPAPIAGDTLTISSSMSTDWLFTFRPRVGAVVANNWLLYATGGVAVTELKANWSFLNPIGPYTEAASAKSTKAGWTVGAGFETMLPGRWTIGAEYLYVKFDGISGSGVIGAPATPPFSNVFTHSTDLVANIVRVRLNKLF